MAKKHYDPSSYIGEYIEGVTLETCREDQEKGITRPRVRPLDHFESTLRVEFPRKLRELFPIGTRYKATIKVCQKSDAKGRPAGRPYLRASDIALIPESVPDAAVPKAVARTRAALGLGLGSDLHKRSKCAHCLPPRAA